MKYRVHSVLGTRLFQCIFLLSLFSGIAGFGQAGRGAINGSITDQTGAIVSGAKVTLLNNATGVAIHATSNSSGNYAFISLNPGVYSVTATQ
ncbi:MAG: carboxypeptidase-like regulatory domain-containing protein, partial [Acidobacteriaceae bacterium]